MRYESASVKENTGLDPTALSPTNPREKWLRKRTQVKLRVSLLQLFAGQVILGVWAATCQMELALPGRAVSTPAGLSAYEGAGVSARTWLPLEVQGSCGRIVSCQTSEDTDLTWMTLSVP